MKVIWKYELKVTGKRILDLPKGAEILTLQEQYGVPCLWVLCDNSQRTEERIFQTLQTGVFIDVIIGTHIGTFQLQNGNYVGHVFEI